MCLYGVWMRMRLKVCSRRNPVSLLSSRNAASSLPTTLSEPGIEMVVHFE